MVLADAAEICYIRMKTMLIKHLAFLAIATIGLERLNVLPWSGSFVQLYYLLAAPFLGLLCWRHCKEFSKFYMLLLFVMAGSLISNGLYDAYYWKKFILVGFVILATFGLAVYFFSSREPKILANSLKLYVLLNIVVTFFQMYNFFQGGHISGRLDASRFLNLDAVVIGDYFRLSGYSLDTNKGVFNFGYALIFLTLVADRGWFWLRVLYPLTFFAHSRSTLISILPALFMKSKWYAAVTVGLYLLVLLFLTPAGVFDDRFGMKLIPSSSNQTRLGLIRLWGDAMVQSSWEQVVFGHGFAGSGQYLNQLLGTTYGDFANGYLTLCYELGLAGIVLMGILFFRLWRNFDQPARSMLLLPLLLFQLFYSNLAEPIIIFALSYFYLQHRGSQPFLPTNNKEA
ncbi:MAG: hypothetical protein ABI479_00665 [Gallionella sp.]